jgi:type VI secretion system protein ImpF
MKPADKNKKLRMPVLDCLLDDQPDASSEPALSSSMRLEQLRESLRRDLESLFNSRQCSISPPDNCAELSASLLNYGLPDPATINLNSSHGIKTFCSRIETTITDFEPRIKSVRVVPRGKDRAEDSIFRFRVEALLHASPANETIVFDSSLDPVSQSVSMREQPL